MIVPKVFIQITDFKLSIVNDLFAFLTPKRNQLKWIKSPLWYLHRHLKRNFQVDLLASITIIPVSESLMTE